MTDSLDELLADIDALEDADDEDTYPWYDAWTWTAEPEPWMRDYVPELDLPPVPIAPAPRLMPRSVLGATLRVVLADGRAVSWSVVEGWDGDEALVAAAKAVAGLHSGLDATTAVARGLVAIAVDGWIDPLVWIAARL